MRPRRRRRRQSLLCNRGSWVSGAETCVEWRSYYGFPRPGLHGAGAGGMGGGGRRRRRRADSLGEELNLATCKIVQNVSARRAVDLVSRAAVHYFVWVLWCRRAILGV